MTKSLTQSAPETEIAILRVHIDGRSDISRDIEIRSSSSLYNLAEAIIIDAYNWDFDHAFGFFSNLEDYRDSSERYELFADMGEVDGSLSSKKSGSVKKTKVWDVFNVIGKKMLFLFDYGDEHLFVVELIVQIEKNPKHGYPIIFKSTGDSPEQYETDH